MSVTIKERSEKEKDDFKEIPIGVKWEWDEDNRCLTFKTNIALNEKNDKKNKNKGRKLDLRSGVPRYVTQNRQRNETISKSDLQRQVLSDISINDVKNAAIYMLSERYFIPNEFENFCNDQDSKYILEDFLLHLANYFHWFFEEIDASKLNNPVCIERSFVEKERIENAKIMIKKTLKGLARGYSMLILGIGSCNFHHMNCGKIRASCGYRDRGLYETLYPFCVFFIWIAFSRRDYESIRTEVGRLLKSNAFNTEIKESIVDEESETKENISREKSADRKSQKSSENIKQIHVEQKLTNTKRFNAKTLSKQRSPALVSLMPLPQEKSKWLFNRRGENIKQILDTEKEDEMKEDEDGVIRLLSQVGIIGQPARLFNLITLAPRGKTDEENPGDLKSEFSEQAPNAQSIENASLETRIYSQMSRPTTVGSNISIKE